jgi:hypothetical protein
MMIQEAKSGQPAGNEDKVETAWMGLKAPVEFFERLDRWREAQPHFVKPSRPAAIRWIVWQFLEGEAAKEAAKAAAVKAKRPKRRK